MGVSAFSSAYTMPDNKENRAPESGSSPASRSNAKPIFPGPAGTPKTVGWGTDWINSGNATPPVTDGNWHHVAVTFDRSAIHILGADLNGGGGDDGASDDHIGGSRGQSDGDA